MLRYGGATFNEASKKLADTLASNITQERLITAGGAKWNIKVGNKLSSVAVCSYLNPLG